MATTTGSNSSSSTNQITTTMTPDCDYFCGSCPGCKYVFFYDDGIKTTMFPCPSGRKYVLGEPVPLAVSSVERSLSPIIKRYIGECPHCSAAIYGLFKVVRADKTELARWNEEREANIHESGWSDRHPMPRDTYILSSFSDL
jgi:hypothetical protein